MRWVARIATLVYGILILVPFILAFDRLIWAAGTTPAEWFSRLDTITSAKGQLNSVSSRHWFRSFSPPLSDYQSLGNSEDIAGLVKTSSELY